MHAATPANASTEKILIAEDSPTQAQRLRFILERQGYQVGVAGNGRLALEMAASFKPDLIISDVVMPEMDGYQFSSQVKADADLCDIPVILVTTMADPQDVIRGLECGADNFVLKPYEEPYLLGRVRYALINREMRRPQDAGMGVEIYFNNQRHFITADRLQILNLLLSTYDAAIQRNRELKDSQQALEKRSVEADSANRAKSSFLATMSHEIRTPMNGVLGMLELLGLTNLDTEQRAILHIVRASSNSLLRIIDDILDFSKIEAGKLEVRPEVASIQDVIEDVHNVYSGTASAKGLLIAHQVDPHISPAVLVDSVRLRQILSNLVSNALKFTSHGSIRIKAALVARTDGEDRVQFSVTDTGSGISAQDQRLLFEPFSQGDSERARRSGGTGLGLAICRRLAALMGGSVEMASELGTGTTMLLTLPLPIANPEQLPRTDLDSARDLLSTTTKMRRMAPSVEEAEAEGTLALLVDDHPTNRQLLMRQAHALGYAAESAENGVQALEQWKTGRFGIVITDCNMPEMDGYALARSIRHLESGTSAKRIPIIACTANALGGEAELCLAAGMDDYLAKPVELRQILRKLEQWLPIPEQPEMATTPSLPSLPSLPAQDDTTTDPPIDHSVLADILGGDTAAARDIFMDFRRVNNLDVEMLQQAVAASDMALAGSTSHRIKGASRMVGALGLAGVCEQIEQASWANDVKTVASQMGAFDQELLRLNAYLGSL